MNFTREPIIETIISPRDGCKLLVKSSKGGNAEEYYVDALEVISFGKAFFFRSLESPKSFLLPTSDYEVVEVKETKVALKNASYEKNIKIGGGREAPVRPKEVAEPAAEPSPAEPVQAETRSEKRRDRRRHRRRRMEEGERVAPPATGEAAQAAVEAAPPVFVPLIPPPSTLISQTLSRYKGKEFFDDPDAAPENKEETKTEEPGADSAPLHRALVAEEVTPTAYFSAISETDPPQFFL